MEPVISPIAHSYPSGDQEHPESGQAPLASLRLFARTRPAAERCDLCGAEIASEHRHLLDWKARQIACSCGACAILFCGQQGARYLRIPQRILRLDGFRFTDAQWDAMMLPINLAFFLRRLNGKTVAMYPSPAGAMESAIELPKWEALFDGATALSAIEPEVEALLVNRIGDDPAYYIVPIDACYRLVGSIRSKWRGLSGGAEVWNAIADFFGDLSRRACQPSEASHA